MQNKSCIAGEGSHIESKHPGRSFLAVSLKTTNANVWCYWYQISLPPLSFSSSWTKFIFFLQQKEGTPCWQQHQWQGFALIISHLVLLNSQLGLAVHNSQEAVLEPPLLLEHPIILTLHTVVWKTACKKCLICRHRHLQCTLFNELTKLTEAWRHKNWWILRDSPNGPWPPPPPLFWFAIYLKVFGTRSHKPTQTNYETRCMVESNWMAFCMGSGFSIWIDGYCLTRPTSSSSWSSSPS